ncbi:MAG: glycoside hydrolase family 9 protein [Vampirovibrionales bacterium]
MAFLLSLFNPYANAAPLQTPDARIWVAPAGYHTQSQKTAYISGVPGTQPPSVTLYNPKKPGLFPGQLGKTVYKAISVRPANPHELHINGGSYPVWQADFSSFTTAGDYELRVLPRVKSAHNVFPVAIPKSIALHEFVYWDAMVPALRGLYLTRSGAKVAYNEVYRPASHTNDAWLQDGDSVRLKDVSGGWYNGAKDYRKITTPTAFALGCWLQAALANPDAFLNLKLNYPVGEPNLGDIPDTFHELKWGLDWLLAMQGVHGQTYHQVANTESLIRDDASPAIIALGFPTLRPDEDDSPRWVSGLYRQDTAASVAAWAMAARAFKKPDLALSVKYLMAAQRGWVALQAMSAPLNPAETDYLVADDTPYRIWAAWSLYRATNENRYRLKAHEWLNEWATHANQGNLSIIHWQNPLLLAWMDGLSQDTQTKKPEETNYNGTQALQQETWQRARAALYGIELSTGKAPLDLPSFPESLWLDKAPTVATLQAVAAVLSQAPLAPQGVLPQSTLIYCSWAMDRLLGFNRHQIGWLSGTSPQAIQQPGHAVAVAFRKPLEGLLVDGPSAEAPHRYDDAWDNAQNHSELWRNALTGWVLATLHQQWQLLAQQQEAPHNPDEALPTRADLKRWKQPEEPAARTKGY